MDQAERQRFGHMSADQIQAIIAGLAAVREGF
jgi:hypothetical protein